MKSGSLPQRNLVGVITGPVGSGKTTLLHHLFGMAPPDLYTSTGLAEQSIRGFLHHIVQHLSAGVWRRLSYHHIREFLTSCMLAGMKESDINSLASLIINNMDPISSDPFPFQGSPLPALNMPSPLPVVHSLVEQNAPSAHDESPFCQNILPLVKSANNDSTVAGDLILELVHMIDTGGQPELMEVMPSLIHNANLAIVVTNLEYRLSEYPKINYHDRGIGYELSSQLLSQYTGKDIILKLASTMKAKVPSSEPFHLLIVATHRDCVRNNLEARVEEINHDLDKLLLPAFQNELILCETPKKIAFVINLKTPGGSDQEMLEKIRTKVSMQNLGKSIDVPSSFFMFEQDIIAYATKVKRDILSLTECRQVGARLEMGDEVVQAALVLFHRQNTFLYFRHVLPNHVFVDPQIPLDIVNSIVRFSYKVSSGELKGFPAKYVTQLHNGFITEELLACDTISPHFEKGIYEVHDNIQLLCHTFTLASMQPDTYKNKKVSASADMQINEPALVEEKNKEYLMMCLKPAIPDQKLHNNIPKRSDTVPLIVKFSSGCAPLGCFSGIISCLISQYCWQVISKDNVPKCLARNIASLHDPDLLVNVVLVDFTQHLEIHNDSDLVIRDSPADICSQVYTKVTGAIEKVFGIMHISQEQINVSPAVFCRCPDQQERHFASFVRSNGKYFLCCDNSKSTFAPSVEQLLWMGVGGQLVAKRPRTGDQPDLIQPSHICTAGIFLT